MRVMRAARNIAFLIFCLALLYPSQEVFAACYAPGLVGSGDTEQAAYNACVSYGQSNCSNLCNQSCTTNWESIECDDPHPPEPPSTTWLVTGRCKCEPIP
jgi:hypothetical protein